MQDANPDELLSTESPESVQDHALSLVSGFSAFVLSVARNQRIMSARITELNRLISSYDGSRSAAIESLNSRLERLENHLRLKGSDSESSRIQTKNTLDQDGEIKGKSASGQTGFLSNSSGKLSPQTGTVGHDTVKDEENKENIMQQRVAGLPATSNSNVQDTACTVKLKNSETTAMRKTHHVGTGWRQRTERKDGFSPFNIKRKNSPLLNTPMELKKSKTTPKSAPHIRPQQEIAESNEIQNTCQPQCSSTPCGPRKNHAKGRKKVRVTDCYEDPETLPLESPPEERINSLLLENTTAPFKICESAVKPSEEQVSNIFACNQQDKSPQNDGLSEAKLFETKNRLRLETQPRENHVTPGVSVPLNDIAEGRLSTHRRTDEESDAESSSPWLKVRREKSDQWNSQTHDKHNASQPQVEVVCEKMREPAGYRTPVDARVSPSQETSVDPNRSCTRSALKTLDSEVNLHRPRFADRRFPNVAAAVRFVEQRRDQNMQEEQGVFNDVVRGSARAELEAVACKDCDAFFRSIAAKDPSPVSDVAFRLISEIFQNTAHARIPLYVVKHIDEISTLITCF